MAPKGTRFIEFLLVGGATPFLFVAAWGARRALGLDASEFAIGFLTFYAAYVVNDPHFAVTYLLFYKDARTRAFGGSVSASQRARWLFAGVIAPVALVGGAAFALATHSAQTIGWMVQLMFLLVGWHYVKQGFGVLTVLSQRRGVVVSRLERAALLAHCYAGWAFAWANPTLPAGEFEEKGVVYRAVAHPRWFELVSGGVLALSTVVVLVVLLGARRREGRFLPFAPVAGLLITVWSWTIFSSIDPLVRYVIPALHSVQYLYFVGLMKRNEAQANEGPPNFGRPTAVRLGVLAASALALGWFLFHGAPSFLDAALVHRVRGVAVDESLGETPYVAAFFVVVNLHHYVMDFVIWRRENPDTRYLRDAPRLIADEARSDDATPESARLAA